MRAHLIGVLALLAGCGALPRPFQPESMVVGADPVARLGPRASLMVAPIAGLPPEPARGQAEAVARELRRRDVVASSRAGGRASWLLQVESLGPERYRWRLIDPQGREEAAGGPVAGNAAQLATAVDQAMEGLGGAPGRQRQGVRLLAVEGLPAEADRVLRLAMKAELRRLGIPVVEEGEDALALRGKVSRSAAGAEEELAIAWTVATPAGEDIASVNQQNRLPKGQIDGRWASIAGAVAAGAVEDIAGVVQAWETQRPARN